MEAHGGYLTRLDGVEAGQLVRLARQALAEDGHPSADCALLICLHPDRRLARLAFDAPYTYGRKGARWYEEHHGLARLLSAHGGPTVHAYVFDPEQEERVVTYADGHRVGGDRVRYEDAELPDDDDGLLDEVAFERLKARWPLGHLARILGVAREELVHLAREQTVLLPLDGEVPKGLALELFGPGSTRRTTSREWRPSRDILEG